MNQQRPGQAPDAAGTGGDPADVIVVAGGTPPRREVLAQLAVERAVVVAADSGLDHAEALGLPVAVVVGDLDSASPGALARAERAGVEVQRHPVDKDKTDLELALDVAVARTRPGSRVVVVASGGGRLDHATANLLLLGSVAYAAIRLEAFIDSWHVSVVRGESQLVARPGQPVTLLPVGGAVRGVRTGGLAYPLRGETLEAGTSRGVSNRAEANPITVRVARGALLVLREWAD